MFTAKNCPASETLWKSGWFHEDDSLFCVSDWSVCGFVIVWLVLHSLGRGVSVRGIRVHTTRAFCRGDHRGWSRSVLPSSITIQAMWTIHGIPPQDIIVSCRLTDNMAQGIHLWLHIGSDLCPLVRIPIQILHAHEQVPRVWEVKRTWRTSEHVG